jgi:hypothetical protein
MVLVAPMLVGPDSIDLDATFAAVPKFRPWAADFLSFVQRF